MSAQLQKVFSVQDRSRSRCGARPLPAVIGGISATTLGCYIAGLSLLPTATAPGLSTCRGDSALYRELWQERSQSPSALLRLARFRQAPAQGCHAT